MDICFSPNYSETVQSQSPSSSSDSVQSPESISSSDNVNITNFFSSDEENGIILASNSPKKRSGRTKFKETRHPVYRGIRKRNNEKWVCELREPNTKTRIWLGTYSTPEMAARAHDVAAIALRGKSACLNFADSVWRLPVPVSSDAKDIRKAAAEAAKAFAFEHQQQELEHSEVEVVSSMKKLEKLLSAPEKVVFYMDELDGEFEIQHLLADMAQGLLLSPPCYSMGKGMDWDGKEIEYTTDVYLWNY